MEDISADWETLKSLINDLELLLSADADEIQSLDEIKRLRVELRSLILARELDARKIITGTARGEQLTQWDLLRSS